MSATTHHRPDSNATFVDALLAEQRQFTAVDQFARAHERDELPANARHYRNLLPAAAPGPGQNVLNYLFNNTFPVFLMSELLSII